MRLRWRGVALWLFLCVEGAVAYVQFATPEFVATTQVVLEPHVLRMTTNDYFRARMTSCEDATRFRPPPSGPNSLKIRGKKRSTGLGSSPQITTSKDRIVEICQASAAKAGVTTDRIVAEDPA